MKMNKIKNILIYLILSIIYFIVFHRFLITNISSVYTITTLLSFFIISLIFLYNKCQFDKTSAHYIMIISLILPILQINVLSNLSLTNKTILFIMILFLIYSDFIKVFSKKLLIIPIIQVLLFIINIHILTMSLILIDIAICLYFLIIYNKNNPKSN